MFTDDADPVVSLIAPPAIDAVVPTSFKSPLMFIPFCVTIVTGSPVTASVGTFTAHVISRTSPSASTIGCGNKMRDWRRDSKPAFPSCAAPNTPAGQPQPVVGLNNPPSVHVSPPAGVTANRLVMVYIKSPVSGSIVTLLPVITVLPGFGDVIDVLELDEGAVPVPTCICNGHLISVRLLENAFENIDKNEVCVWVSPEPEKSADLLTDGLLKNPFIN